MPGHGSGRPDWKIRTQALEACIWNLQTLFAAPQCTFDRIARAPIPANAGRSAKVDVIVCTYAAKHVLDRLTLPPGFYSQRDCECNPRYLAFECQDVLKANLGSYDYYCFLEDDLVLHDPWLFEKLRWFCGLFGNRALLQPHRFERSLNGPVRRFYVDEDIPLRVTERFQDITRDAELTASYMDTRLTFRRQSNPHSGCYFLNAAQMEYWAAQPDFAKRDASFVGPLDSGATLGIMRNFNIYKPALDDASFLEVEHFGDTFLQVLSPDLARGYAVP
jgi:hypothetical protein